MGHAPYTYEETVKAANQAFKEGRLGFQKLERAELGCLYRYPDGGCCAIGARVKPNEIHSINNGSGVKITFDDKGIFEEYTVKGSNNNKLYIKVLDVFVGFQVFHDDLCRAVKQGGLTIKEAEAKWRKKFIT